jgi:hypothetical protein
VHISQHWIEFLIPTTILITAMSNVLIATSIIQPALWITYTSAIGFGLIHGAGFSTYLRMIMDDGSSFASQLFQFNCGVELGQLLILFVILSLTTIAARLHLHRGMNLVGSCIGGGLAIWMMIERTPF